MMYFYRIHVQKNQDAETVYYSTATGDQSSTADASPPVLTKEMVASHAEYRKLMGKSRAKMVFVDYEVYETDVDFSKVDAARLDAYLMGLIENKTASRMSGGEFTIAKGEKKAKPKAKRRKKRHSSVSALALCGVAILMLVFGVAIGRMTANPSGEPTDPNTPAADGEDSEFIMPEPVEINPKAEQITVTIDRSYSAVPKEDIILKGELVNGVAKVALPAFNPEDYFTHVPGFSWGFSRDSEGVKAEYESGGTYEFTQDVKLYRVLQKFGGGSGTQSDPYIINYFDQLGFMEKARGYFKQTEDIEFPNWSQHTPINTVNELKAKPETERFEYNGGGFSIKGLSSPLFGKVSGASIKGVHITESNIAIAGGNFGFLVCEAYNYRYAVNGVEYETGETMIQNCSVTASSVTIGTSEEVVPPESANADEEGTATPPPQKEAEYVLGGITGLGGRIENCLVEEVGMYIVYSGYYRYAGGISGKPANVINSGAYNIGIGGNVFYIGGIAGSAMGARMYNAAGEELPDVYGGNIQGCFVRFLKAGSEIAAGGIVGEGGSNAVDALISNCYSHELTFSVGVFSDAERKEVITNGLVGGIIGADGNEKYGHLITNTVSPTGYSLIGASKLSVYNQETVRLAPEYAFSLESMLEILNRNTVNPNNPKEIYGANFTFAEGKDPENARYQLPFPAEIAELYDKGTEEEAS